MSNDYERRKKETKCQTEILLMNLSSMLKQKKRSNGIRNILGNFISVFLVSVGLIFMFYTPVYAQLTDNEIAAGLESCFQYYDYGKVGVNLATEKSQYKKGETVKIIGTVVNQNTFPLMDVIIYAQLRRMNLSGDVVNEGHYLLERKEITPAMNLLPDETRFITASFPILDTC